MSDQASDRNSTIHLLKRPALHEPVIQLLTTALDTARNDENASNVLVVLTFSDQRSIVACYCHDRMLEMLGQIELAKRVILDQAQR